jgi:hypothetical protein
MKVCYTHGAFILGFADGITGGLLNIIIFKYYVSDFICKVSLKFFICTKNFTNPSRFFNFFYNYIGIIVNSHSEMH